MICTQVFAPEITKLPFLNDDIIKLSEDKIKCKTLINSTSVPFITNYFWFKPFTVPIRLSLKISQKLEMFPEDTDSPPPDIH